MGRTPAIFSKPTAQEKPLKASDAVKVSLSVILSSHLKIPTPNRCNFRPLRPIGIDPRALPQQSLKRKRGLNSTQFHKLCDYPVISTGAMLCIAQWRNLFLGLTSVVCADSRRVDNLLPTLSFYGSQRPKEVKWMANTPTSLLPNCTHQSRLLCRPLLNNSCPV